MQGTCEGDFLSGTFPKRNGQNRTGQEKLKSHGYEVTKTYIAKNQSSKPPPGTLEER